MFCCVCKFLRRSTKNKSKHQRQRMSSHNKNKNKKKCNQKVDLTSNKLKKHQLEYQLKNQHQHQLGHKENRLSQRSRTSKITRRRIHVSVILFIISKAI